MKSSPQAYPRFRPNLRGRSAHDRPGQGTTRARGKSLPERPCDARLGWAGDVIALRITWLALLGLSVLTRIAPPHLETSNLLGAVEMPHDWFVVDRVEKVGWQ
jgi:hypothetical protein